MKEKFPYYEYFQEKPKLPNDMNKKGKLKHIGEDNEIKNGSGEYIETEDFRAVTEEYLKKKK